MMKPSDIIDMGKDHAPREIWVSALDLVDHVLQRDTDQTIFKNLV